MSREARDRELEAQRLAQELTYLRQALEALQSRATALATLRESLNSAKEVLEELKRRSEGDEILVPIGGGVYVLASVRKVDYVLVQLGARYAIEKKVDDAIKYIDERIGEVDDALRRTQQQMSEVSSRMTHIESQIRRILGELEQR